MAADMEGSALQWKEIWQSANVVGSTEASSPQDRLKRRIPELMARAREGEELYGNPLDALIRFMDSLPGDYETWQQIVSEVVDD